MKFDTTYNTEMTYLEESPLKAMALAGMIAAGSPEMAHGAQTVKSTPIATQTASQVVPDRVVLNAIIDFTAGSEGFTNSVYMDTKNIPTIGYGTNLRESHNLKLLTKLGYDTNKLIKGTQKLKKEDARKLLEAGLLQAISDARAYLPNFDEQPLRVKAVLTDMSYNLGRNKLNDFHEMRKGLIARDYKYVKFHMIHSFWYKQVASRGRKLVRMMDDVIKLEK